MQLLNVCLIVRPDRKYLIALILGVAEIFLFHVQVKELPAQWDCKVCHKPAQFAASVTPQSDEKVPDPRRGYVDPSVLNPVVEDTQSKFIPSPTDFFTPEHHAAVRARRTEAELEALLEERLAILRATGSAGRPLDS